MSDYKAPTVGQAPGGEIRVPLALKAPLADKPSKAAKAAAGVGCGGLASRKLWRHAIGWPEGPGPPQSKPGKEEAPRHSSSWSWCYHPTHTGEGEREGRGPSQKVQWEHTHRCPPPRVALCSSACKPCSVHAQPREEVRVPVLCRPGWRERRATAGLGAPAGEGRGRPRPPQPRQPWRPLQRESRLPSQSRARPGAPSWVSDSVSGGLCTWEEAGY